MPIILLSFFFNDTATTEIYTLSLHDALPISISFSHQAAKIIDITKQFEYIRLYSDWYCREGRNFQLDRKSTRLNSSHLGISYAVFCLKKKKKKRDDKNQYIAHK